MRGDARVRFDRWLGPFGGGPLEGAVPRRGTVGPNMPTITPEVHV